MNEICPDCKRNMVYSPKYQRIICIFCEFDNEGLMIKSDDQLFILPNNQMFALMAILFIVAGSITLTFFPERIDMQCLTENQQWVENGIRYVGN